MRPTKIVKNAAFAATLLLAICARAQFVETVLHNFGAYGAGTQSGLVADRSGNFYGVSGIEFFELTPKDSGGWNYTALSGGAVYAYGPMVMDRAGNFFVSNYFADLYEYSPDGAGGWTETVPYYFNEGTSNLIIDARDNLYGVAAGGGVYGDGYVFELSPISGGGWSLTDLHDFNGENGITGGGPSGMAGGLIMDAKGNFYGTTLAGGYTTNCSGGCGVVFQLTNKSGVWIETVLHRFTGTDGANPNAPLLMDAGGNLYGTTTAGGTAGFGGVFELLRNSGKWHARVLHNFTDVNDDGAMPGAALIMDDAGNLYGTTAAGGPGACQVVEANGCGTAFRLSPKGNTWKTTILHDFVEEDGVFPSGLISDGHGKLYGTTGAGGKWGEGDVFELSPKR